MTREEARKAAEVMLAYANGKEIETETYKGWTVIEDPKFGWDYQKYRIKPEPKYRPFRSVRECWQEMRKHEPFGWLKPKDVEDNYTYLVELCEPYNFQTDFDNYTFADGAPFGIQEE